MPADSGPFVELNKMDASMVTVSIFSPYPQIRAQT